MDGAAFEPPLAVTDRTDVVEDVQRIGCGVAPQVEEVVDDVLEVMPPVYEHQVTRRAQLNPGHRYGGVALMHADAPRELGLDVTERRLAVRMCEEIERL